MLDTCLCLGWVRGRVRVVGWMGVCVCVKGSILTFPWHGGGPGGGGGLSEEGGGGGTCPYTSLPPPKE